MRRGVALLLMDEREFRAVVAEAIDALPERFRRHVGDTVEIVVEDEPKPEHLGALPPRRVATGAYEVYGMYCGVPLAMRGGAPAAPSLIVLFMGPCLRANADDGALAFQVRNLVEHELGHHFGLTEAEVAAAHHRKRSQERKNPGY